jgi:AsmA protein
MIRKFFIGTSLFLALVIVALIVTIKMLDLNKYKPQITKAVKDASGYELQIKGDITTSFSPIGIAASDISLSTPDKKAFSTLKTFKVALDAKALLDSKTKVNYLVLADVDLHVIKQKNGKFNFEVEKKVSKNKTEKKDTKNEEEDSKLPLLNVDEVHLENVNIAYEDMIEGTKASLSNIGLLLQNIGYDSSKEPKQALEFEGKLNVGQIAYKAYKIKDLQANFSFHKAIAKIESMKYTLFDSQGSGNASLDISGQIPHVSFVQDIPKLQLANFSKEILKKELFEGVLNLHVNLSTSLGTQEKIKKDLQGVILADGKGIGIKGYDLDKLLNGYDKSQNIDAVDIGSFLVAGPVGFALSKSSDGAQVYSAVKGGATLIKHVHTKLDFKNHIGNLSDVALATGKSRVALKGTLNMVSEKIAIKVGILDAKGCAKYSQSIGGSFSKPKVEVDEGTVKTVINMASSLLGKSKDLLGVKSNTKCSIFYNGVVKQP